MTLTKAARAQRKRRKAENDQKVQKSSLDNSDSELEINSIKKLAKPSSTSSAHTFWSLPGEFSDKDLVIDYDYEDEDNNIIVNNQIIHTIEQNILDSEDEDACDQGFVNPNLWPAFLQRDESNTSVGKRVNKDGVVMKGYKNPIQHTDKSNSKLMSRPIAKQTQSYRKKKMKKALGNGPSISSYFTKSVPINNKLSSSSSHDKDVESDSEKDDDVDDVEDTTYNKMIDLKFQQYSDTRKIAKGPADQLQKIIDQWEELESALRQAKVSYLRKHEANPQFSIPNFDLDELREFNSRRKELSIEKAKSPAITASILTAQSSCRRLPDTKRANKFINGISRARKIRFQAAHLVRFKELSLPKAGFSEYQAHPSLLDNPSIRKELFQWSSTQKPGDVSFSFTFNFWLFTFFLIYIFSFI